MSRVAAILFSIVLATHYGYAPLSMLWDDPVRAARAIFYIARGIEGFVLYMLVAALIVGHQSGRKARPTAGDYAVLGVCAWGAIEEGLTAICRLSVGIASPPAGRAQCDAVTGMPVFAISLCAVVAMLALWPRDVRRES